MARFLVPGGTGNFNSTSNWSASSGGASGASFPTVSDDVIFDNNSTNATIIVNATSAALSLSASPAYAGTLMMNGQLTVSGNITTSTGMTLSGASTLVVNTASSITSNGKIWPGPVTFSISSTKTLNDNFTVNGLFTSLTTTQTLAGSGNLILNGGLTMTAAMTGPNTVFLSGGTWAGAGVLGTPLTLNGTTTIGNASFGSAGSNAMNYLSGTVTPTGTLIISNNATLQTSSVTWNNITVSSSAAVLTLNSDLYGIGILSSGAATSTVFNGNNINWKGFVTIGTNWGGTSNFNLVGTTQLSGTAGTSIFTNNITLSAGTITQTSFTYRTGIITINSGVIVNSSGVIIVNTGTPSINNNAAGITFNQISLGGVPLVISGNTGLNINQLVFTSAVATNFKLKTGNTYTINTLLSASTSTALIHHTISSDTSGTKTFLNLAQGATQDISFVNGTDVDSSGGRTIWSYKPVLTNTVNWNSLVPPSQISSVF